MVSTAYHLFLKYKQRYKTSVCTPVSSTEVVSFNNVEDRKRRLNVTTLVNLNVMQTSY